MVSLPNDSSIDETAVVTENVPSGVVQQRAAQALRHSAYAPLTTLRCEFHDGVLTVRGQLPSFHLKQVAQTVLCDVEGVGMIDNRVDVVDARPR
jgi:hypothetical protein